MKVLITGGRFGLCISSTEARLDVCSSDCMCLVSESEFCLGLPEKAMAAHSGTLAWRVPWTEEPGGLQRMGPQMAGHDRAGTHVHAQGCVRA